MFFAFILMVDSNWYNILVTILIVFMVMGEYLWGGLCASRHEVREVLKF